MNLARNSYLRRGSSRPDSIGATNYGRPMGISPAGLAMMLKQHGANVAGQMAAAHPALNVGAMAAGLAAHPAAVTHPAFFARPPAFSQPLAAAAAGSGEPEAAYWGVDSGGVLIPAGNAATITVQPQEACWPAGMNVTGGIADNFLISGIFVGVQPLLTTTGAISAAIFVQNTTAPRFRRIFLPVGQNFSVGVVNIDTIAAHRFAATAFGPSAEPRGTCA